MTKILPILIAMVVIAIAIIVPAGADPFLNKGSYELLQKNVHVSSGIDMVWDGGASDLDMSDSTGYIHMPVGGILGNGYVSGNWTVVGILTAGSVVNNGVIDGDVRLAANHSFYSTAGSGAIDWSNATGAFKPPTGTNTFGGIADFNAAMTTRGITQDSGYSLVQSGAAGITVGTTGITASASPLKVLENVTIAANKSLTGLSGSGAVDFSAMTGGYNSPLGTNTFNGNILGAGLTTTTTGGGAVTLKGNTTVYTDKSLAVTTADKLSVASVIVPTDVIITVPLETSDVDTPCFIADDAYTILKIEEIHAVAQNTAYPNTGSLTVTKCTGTTAPGSGTALHNSTMYLNSTVNTIVTPTLNAATGVLNLADGDKIGLNFNGTMTTFDAGVVVITMKRI